MNRRELLLLALILILAGLLRMGWPAEVTGDAVWLAGLVTQGRDVHALAGPQAFRSLLAAAPNFNLLLSLGELLALAGAGLAVNRWREADGARAPGVEAGLVLVLWLAAPILFFPRHSTPVFPHYFILLFPAPYLLAGLSLDALMGRLPAGWPRASVWLVPLAIAGAQAWLFLALPGFIGTQAMPGAFGPPLAKLMAVAEAARRLEADEIIVAGPGSDPAVDEVPAVFEVLLHGTPNRLVDGRWAGAVDLREGEGRVVLALGEGEQPALRAAHWRAGDLIVEIFALEGEGAAVRAGMYAYPSLFPAAVLDAGGSPARDWVEFPIE